jgi:hypothetical protein
MIVRLLSLAALPYGYAQVAEQIQSSSSDNKISFTIYTGLLHSNEDATFAFYIINDINEGVEQVRIVPSSLTLKEAAKFSLAPSFIGSDEIGIDLE